MIDIQPVLNGDRLAISRLLSQVENDTPIGQQGLAELFPHTGRAYLIGVTGATGTGKSSLVNQIAFHYRNPENGGQPKKVAIVAVDPSSPFSGGALLGDRIRMTALSGDDGVFIRSMASRGSLGGLANATAGVVQVFDAANYEIILIETVGAGQAEVDIARLAHTTIVVEAPGLGDDIQAIKAGILEIADILVVNKADRSGVEGTERALKNMLQLAQPMRREFYPDVLKEVPRKSEHTGNENLWEIPVQRTIATDGNGVADLITVIAKHQTYLKQTGDLQIRERTRLANELNIRLQATLMSEWRENLPTGLYDEVLGQLVNRELSPHMAVEILLSKKVKK
ncbi:MAG: methylmalonyl Co-A mutase-associated GTPase MeaB [Anaerolineales bacterium]|jgi:LAO/AO transport system kinase